MRVPVEIQESFRNPFESHYKRRLPTALDGLRPFGHAVDLQAFTTAPDGFDGCFSKDSCEGFAIEVVPKARGSAVWPKVKLRRSAETSRRSRREALRINDLENCLHAVGS
jgi:hypothetical protein